MTGAVSCLVQSEEGAEGPQASSASTGTNTLASLDSRDMQ